MPRRHSRRSKRMSRRISKRVYKGGDGAAENMLRVVGDSNTQFNNVFGPGNTNSSNVVVPLQSGSSMQNSAPVGGQNGGRRGGRRGGTRGRKGGFFGVGSVINQAIVPFALLGMQQSYRRGHNHNHGTKRRFR